MTFECDECGASVVSGEPSEHDEGCRRYRATDPKQFPPEGALSEYQRGYDKALADAARVMFYSRCHGPKVVLDDFCVQVEAEKERDEKHRAEVASLRAELERKEAFLAVANALCTKRGAERAAAEAEVASLRAENETLRKENTEGAEEEAFLFGEHGQIAEILGVPYAPFRSVDLPALVRAVVAERDALRAHRDFLNNKLDETHTHRCFRCEQTVTAETASRQRLEGWVRRAIALMDHNQMYDVTSQNVRSILRGEWGD